MDATPLQHRGWLPALACFGCGPDNVHGLRFTSVPDGRGGYVGTWTPAPFHEGPPGAVHGAVVAIPMDCNGAWAAIDVFRRRAATEGRDPGTLAAVTGEYTVRLLAPTPIAGPIVVQATVGEPEGRLLRVDVTSSVDGRVTATFTGTMFEVVLPPEQVVDHAAPTSS